MTRLGDLDIKIRSKNAGPFWITADIFCQTRPVYDRLFDKEFITFDQQGRIKLGRAMRGQYQLLGVTGNERIGGLTEGHQKYLERHRAQLR